VLGPSSYLLWRHLARRLLHRPSGFTADVRELSAALGLGSRDSSQSAIARTVRRVERFGAACFIPPTRLVVTPALPPAPRHQLTRLHPIVLCHHERLMAALRDGPPADRQGAHRPLEGRYPLPC
jgi:hypothetical protein